MGDLNNAHCIQASAEQRIHSRGFSSSSSKSDKKLKQGWLIKYDILIPIVENASFRMRQRELCYADTMTGRTQL
jgi:hypothetical protein